MSRAWPRSRRIASLSASISQSGSSKAAIAESASALILGPPLVRSCFLRLSVCQIFTLCGAVWAAPPGLMMAMPALRIALPIPAERGAPGGVLIVEAVGLIEPVGVRVRRDADAEVAE